MFVVRGDEVQAALGRRPEGESGLSVAVGYEEVALGDYIHADEDVGPQEVAPGYSPGWEKDESLQLNGDQIGVCEMPAIDAVHECLAGRNQVALLDGLVGYDAVDGSCVPQGPEWNEVLRWLVGESEIGDGATAEQVTQELLGRMLKGFV